MAPRRDLLFLDTSFHTTKPSSAQPALKHSSAAWEHAISTTNYLHNCNAYVPRSAPDPYARCCTDKAKRQQADFFPPPQTTKGTTAAMAFEAAIWNWGGGALPLQPLRAGNAISPCSGLPAEQARRASRWRGGWLKTRHGAQTDAEATSLFRAESYWCEAFLLYSSSMERWISRCIWQT